MPKFDAILHNERRLRAMTGLPQATFTAFLPQFTAAMERYLARYTLDGYLREGDRALTYTNSPLPSPEGTERPLARPLCDEEQEIYLLQRALLHSKSMAISREESMSYTNRLIQRGGMGLKLSALLIAAMIFGACGKPDTTSISGSTSSSVQAMPENQIKSLLQNPPSTSTTVEIDVYNIRWGRQENGNASLIECPISPYQNILADRAVPQTLTLLNGYQTNLSPTYLPPSDASWLIPISRIPIPYHGRLRGHRGDATFVKCENANRIFVVDKVVAIHEEKAPQATTGATLGAIAKPVDFTSWHRYSDSQFRYSFPYPPDWQTEPSQDSEAVAAISIRGPQWPSFPIVVRVYTGEIAYEKAEFSSAPPILKGDSSTRLSQDIIPVAANAKSQTLEGYRVDRTINTQTAVVSTAFTGRNYTYILTLQYPIGFKAEQSLLDIYTAVVVGFQLDAMPSVTREAPTVEPTQLPVTPLPNRPAPAIIVSTPAPPVQPPYPAPYPGPISATAATP